METLRKHVRQVIAAFLVMVMMVSLVTGYQQEKTVKAGRKFSCFGCSYRNTVTWLISQTVRAVFFN